MRLDPAAAGMIDVLVIFNPEPTSGADMMLWEAAQQLSPARFRVTAGLLTSREAAGDLLPLGQPVVEFRLPGLNGLVWLRFFFSLYRRLRQGPFQVLHVNSYVPGNYARLAAWLARVPVIIDHWHGFTRFTRKRRRICRLLARATTLSLAVSAGVQRHVVTQLQLPPEKVRVLYNGVAVDRCRPRRTREEMRAALDLPAQVPVLAIVSRLDHWGKGHGELFQALAALHGRYPVHGLVIGGGRRQAEMAARVRELGLADRVRFVGQRRDVPDLLAAADIFVLPSHSEGISRSLLEAMAVGLPVVASAVGGTPEVVAHEVNGLLVPAQDATALAQALERLLAQPAWATRLGEAAAATVARKFSLDRLGRELNQVYEDLCRQRGVLSGGGKIP